MVRKISLLLMISSCFLTACSLSTVAENKPEVLPGIFQMEELIPLLEGKTIALVANHTSIINKTHLIDTLQSIGAGLEHGLQIKNIFTPEHGFRGNFEAGETFENEALEESAIQIISLYGNNRKPSKEQLLGIDVVVFDLQDVGVRFYTYISTLHYVMLACAENNIPLILLDRPNPHVNYVDGPVMEEAFKSFVGMHKVPVVYGMTIGEYAKMINGEGWLGQSMHCELSVIKIKNFKRDSKYIFPVKPSPNLPNMRSVYLYPSLCFFEGTAMSVGRGTAYPFQVIGHPEFPDTSFSFTPLDIKGEVTNPKFEGEKCFGINLSDLPADSLFPVKEINISYLLNVYNTVGTGEGFFIDYFELLTGTGEFRNQIIEGLTPEEIKSTWQTDIEAFKKIRAKYLIYPD